MTADGFAGAFAPLFEAVSHWIQWELCWRVKSNTCVHTCQAPTWNTWLSPEREQETLLTLVTDSELTSSYIKIHFGNTDEGSFHFGNTEESYTLWYVPRPSIHHLGDYNGTAERFGLVYRWTHKSVWMRNVSFFPFSLPPFLFFLQMLFLQIMKVFFRDTYPQSWLGSLVVISSLLCPMCHHLTHTDSKACTSTLTRIQRTCLSQRKCSCRVRMLWGS